MSQYYENTNDENETINISLKKNQGKEQILYFEFEIK